MPATHFQDFARDDGSPVTVEYSFAGGSPTTYSPHSGACGGDGAEVEILKAWPNTPAYNEMVGQRMALWGDVIGASRDGCEDEAERLDALIEAADAACQLTDAERERMESWLVEHHVDDGNDDMEF